MASNRKGVKLLLEKASPSETRRGRSRLSALLSTKGETEAMVGEGCGQRGGWAPVGRKERQGNRETADRSDVDTERE